MCTSAQLQYFKRLTAASVSSGYVLLQIVTNLYVNETYILYQCGTTPPAADLVPSGSKFFEIPLTSVALVETIPYAYLVGATFIATVHLAWSILHTARLI